MKQYVVFDLEMCIVPQGEKRKQFGHSTELIQIGAVLLDDSYEIQDTYITYVMPEYGFVNSYIEKLAHINKADVANAPKAEEAIISFLKWIPENAVLVSWSNNDMVQLNAEIDGKGIDIDEYKEVLENWVDCQKLFGNKMNSTRAYKLSEALNITATDYEDGEHNALIDAKNTAMLFKKVETESVLKLSPYLIVNHDDYSDNYYTSNLLSGMITT